MKHVYRVMLLIAWIWLAARPVQAYQDGQAPPGAPGAAGNNWDEYGYPVYDGPEQPAGQPVRPAAAHLPDLRTLPPADVNIQLLSEGRRSLRLANTIWNSGQGPLELTSDLNPETQKTRVHQQIYLANGASRQHLVGEFVWHPTHDHWHFDELTLYELWSLEADYSLGKVVASSDKLSYCLMDTDVIDRANPGFSTRRGYGGCNRREQGLSVGWGDTYKSTLDGQDVDISHVPDGFYALTSTANPNGVIHEQSYDNNSARVYLSIWGERLNVVSLKQIQMAECGIAACE